MSPSANVQAIHSLEDLKGALGRFGGETIEALQTAEQEIRRTLDWLQERLNYWRSEVRRRQEEVRQAEADLDSCLASGYYDEDGRYHAPNCSAEEHALRQAQARLRETEAELQNVQRWMKAMGEAVAQYHVQARRLQDLAATRTEKAQAFLGRKISDLEQYTALIAAGVAMFGPIFLNVVRSQYKAMRNRVGSGAVRLAKRQEIELVQKTGRGTRDWSRSELRQIKNRQFPSGYRYEGHHINNVARFPGLAANPDNIRFVTPKKHKRLHHWKWSNTSGKMFNRKSLMIQWARYK